MRQIKFRAWDKKAKVMSHNPSFVFENGKPQVEKGNEWELMQFTGLFDKNGKEIYEGDVVAVPYIDPYGGLHIETTNAVVRVGFENGQFVIYRIEPQPLTNWCEKEEGEYVSNYGNKIVVSNKTVLEIIGNIYENPELMKYS